MHGDILCSKCILLPEPSLQYILVLHGDDNRMVIGGGRGELGGREEEGMRQVETGDLLKGPMKSTEGRP